MNTTSIAVINGQQIQVGNDEQRLVPIKPICQALGIDDRSQRQKIAEDDILASTVELSTAVGADGKQREMFCLPLKYVYGWLFTINPKNVSEEARPAVMKCRKECYNALYEHSNKVTKRVREENEREIALLKELVALNSLKNEVAFKIKEVNKQIDELRSGRLDSQPKLF